MPCTMQGIGATKLATDAATTILEVLSATTAKSATPYCLVKVKVAQAINIWVTLPTGGKWNGGLRSTGGGGYAGSVGAEEDAVSVGFIGVQTDTGHSATPGAPFGGVFDGSFGMSSPGVANKALQEDFAYRSEHLMAVVGKQLAKSFYGQEPVQSYWYGCSTGGRQGMMMAQRYPEDYNGIVAGAPAIHWDRFQAYQIWPQMVMNQDLGGRVLSPAKQQLATSAAVAACDANDGLKDGLLNDPRACTYNPVNDISITKTGCAAGDDTCLSPVEAGVMQKIWGGSKTASGTQLWPGVERGAATVALAGSVPFGIATEQPKYWVYLDPNWDWKTLNYSNYESFFTKSVEMVGPMMATDNPDLSAFKARGGKLISYHGWADPLIMPEGTVKYFDSLKAKFGSQAEVSSFARLFMIPGMGHCSGGDGPNTFGQLSAKPQVQADHDVFKSLVNWVERGVAPEKIVATKYVDDDESKAVVRTRPLCEYPKIAKYQGTGSIDDAANFACAAP